MADTNDTIDGLLAEFRGYAAGMPPSYHVTMSWHDFRVMLDRLEAAQRRDCASIERIVRDAILGYGEMFRIAPNDESEAELKARAETANAWLERHGFAREEITWTKEEASEL